MTNNLQIDRNWLCAAAAYCFGTGTEEQLAASSLSWLPSAPASDSLFRLADETAADYTRNEDIYGWISDIIFTFTTSDFSADDFRWIATRCVIDKSPSIETAESVARFLNRVAILHPEEFDLLSTFVAYSDDLDDGFDVNLIRVQIIDEYNRTASEIKARFNQYFSSRPNHEWVLGIFE